MKCSKCEKEAIVEIKYAGTRLCREHFVEFIERKVKREIREQVEFKKGDKILVAVSGGKDSMMALYLIQKIFSKWEKLDIESVTVDEGIGDFRVKCGEIAKKFSSEMGIEHKIIKMEDYIGVRIDDVARVDKELTPCTYCGVFRRKILNQYAKEIGANYLILGLNIDDVSQSILMNITNGDVARLARLAPHVHPIEGFVPRILPLRRVLESEVRLYNQLKNIPYYPKRCPYAHLASRDVYREFLNNLEKKNPSVKFAIIDFYDGIRDMVEKKYRKKLKKCRICGEPTMGEICKSCELKIRYEKLKNKI